MGWVGLGQSVDGLGPVMENGPTVNSVCAGIMVCLREDSISATGNRLTCNTGDYRCNQRGCEVHLNTSVLECKANLLNLRGLRACYITNHASKCHFQMKELKNLREEINPFPRHYVRPQSYMSTHTKETPAAKILATTTTGGNKPGARFSKKS